MKAPAGPLLTALLAAIAVAGCRCEPPLPVLGTVPPFTLTTQAGGPLSHTDLDGHIWIADFIYTRCASLCPLLSARMQKLQAGLDTGGIRFVSFTVDPEHDTPAALRAYAAQFHADGARWVFLTGEPAALAALLTQGFHLPASRPSGGDLITHTDRFVLIDAHGCIRGYYEGTDASALARLARDVEGLRRER